MRIGPVIIVATLLSPVVSSAVGGERQTIRKHFTNGEQPTIRATVLLIVDPPTGDLRNEKTATLASTPFGRVKVTSDCNFKSDFTAGTCTYEILAVDSGKRLEITSKTLPGDTNYHLIVKTGAATTRIDAPAPSAAALRTFVATAASAEFENQVRQVLRLGWIAPELGIPRALTGFFGLPSGPPGAGEYSESGQLTSAPLDCAFDATFGYECSAAQQVLRSGRLGFTIE